MLLLQYGVACESLVSSLIVSHTDKAQGHHALLYRPVTSGLKSSMFGTQQAGAEGLQRLASSQMHAGCGRAKLDTLQPQLASFARRRAFDIGFKEP